MDLMIWIDSNFAAQMGMHLDRFKVQRNSPFTATFRCPYCGDSTKNRYKTRGYFFERKGSVLFHCHNCGVHGSLGKMLKEHAPNLFNQYVMEKFRESNANSYKPEVKRVPLPRFDFKPQIEKFAKRKIRSLPAYKHMKTISQLPLDHRAKMYVDARQIPASEHYRLFWVPKFVAWTNAQIPGKFGEGVRDEGRIVFPLIDRFGDVFGFQGRSLDPRSQTRYLTIMQVEDKPRLFGFDVCDLSQPEVWVFEGAFDSMFFKNAVAQLGGENNDLGKLLDLNKCVFVLDNEPRSYDTCERMTKLVEVGHRVVIWPANIAQKDINDMVVKGKYDPHELEMIMRRHTYQGLAAKLQLASWRKAYQRS